MPTHMMRPLLTANRWIAVDDKASVLAQVRAFTLAATTAGYLQRNFNNASCLPFCFAIRRDNERDHPSCSQGFARENGLCRVPSEQGWFMDIGSRDPDRPDIAHRRRHFFSGRSARWHRCRS